MLTVVWFSSERNDPIVVTPRVSQRWSKSQRRAGAASTTAGPFSAELSVVEVDAHTNGGADDQAIVAAAQRDLHRHELRDLREAPRDVLGGEQREGGGRRGNDRLDRPLQRLL